LFIPSSFSSFVTDSASSAHHSTASDCSHDFTPHVSVTATSASLFGLSAAADKVIVPAEFMPVVGTFLQNDSSELEIDEETQLKFIKPSLRVDDIVLPEHVNVLYVNTLEDTYLPDETVVA